MTQYYNIDCLRKLFSTMLASINKNNNVWENSVKLRISSFMALENR